MPHPTLRYRDTYQAHPWVSGQDAAFLDALFPGDALDHQMTQAIRELQKLKRRDSSGHITTIHDLENQLDEANQEKNLMALELKKLRPLVDRLSIPVDELKVLQEQVKTLLQEKMDLEAELLTTRSLVDQLERRSEAGTAIQREDSTSIPVNASSDIQNAKPKGDPISMLQELCQQSSVLRLPTYKFEMVSSIHYRCICLAGDISAESSGRSKKVAKGWAASLALKMLSTPNKKTLERPKTQSTPTGIPTTSYDLAVQ